jgi:ribosome-associated heat shock protein Hsp15
MAGVVPALPCGMRNDRPGNDDEVRLDKWLWAARFFKTRSVATEAVNGGKVELNGLRPKPSKPLKIGDQLRIRVGPFIHTITVRALSDRRGPAAAAALLFEESAESIAARERLREQHRLAPPAHYQDGGRPTKKNRRQLSAFEERQRRRDR